MQIIFGFVHTGDIAKGDALLSLRKQFCPALAKGHRLAAARLHLAHEKYPHADEQQHGKPVKQQQHVPRRVILGLSRDFHVLAAQCLYQLRIIGGKRSKLSTVLVFTLNIISLDHHLANVAALHGGVKFAENNLRFAPVLFAKNGENRKNQERHAQPNCHLF